MTKTNVVSQAFATIQAVFPNATIICWYCDGHADANHAPDDCPVMFQAQVEATACKCCSDKPWYNPALGCLSEY